MKLFNYDSPFWSFMSRLADLIILNLLWIVFCIPVVTIGASTTAMYRVTLNMVRGEGSGVVRMFWDAFRLNLKQAVLIFLILLIPVLLVVYEFWMYLSGAVGQSMWLGCSAARLSFWRWCSPTSIPCSRSLTTASKIR